MNALAAAFRARSWPVVWTHVAYLPSGEDCGIWGTRSDTPDSLQNIKEGSPRAMLDPRMQRAAVRHPDQQAHGSAFFETNLRSLLTFHGIDTVVVTGGSTSGCVRATVVDGLSCGYRMIVPEECVADKHESPHFANLYDMAVKYADVHAGGRGAGRHSPHGGLTPMLRTPGHYDYMPWRRRPRITWPNGARVAFWVAPNIEHYEYDPPPNAAAHALAAPGAGRAPAIPGATTATGRASGAWRMSWRGTACAGRSA